jgi:hypothetical protein
MTHVLDIGHRLRCIQTATFRESSCLIYHVIGPGFESGCFKGPCSLRYIPYPVS